MKSHTKKLIAPIIITFIMVLLFISSAFEFIFTRGLPIWATIIGCLIQLFLAIISIYTLIERMKEIRSGEEDDLSKY
ncbi:hypothetical protein [Clostridium sp. E02]|uniref:hypothetical protein n=1 Tax=Clostridium sp. E02 TaxID=2487134 RepID=UPI000F549302|nr:hypothetical protein [Clostridium sp. E02]